METQPLSQAQIDTILNEHLDENFWLYQLGVGTSPEKVDVDSNFSFPFLKTGIENWEEFKRKLKEIICDNERKVIRPIIDEGILGNARELAVILYTLLTRSHNITVAIAIPLVALVIKYNLTRFCQE